MQSTFNICFYAKKDKQKANGAYPLFLILDAIIFIDVSGCQWRLLPKEYPK